MTVPEPLLDPRPRTQRTDWAHLPPLTTVAEPRPPRTFDGAGFGASVAGARSMTARPHVKRRSAAAPAGVLLDVVKVETIEPVAAPPAPSTIPEPRPPSPTIIHRITKPVDPTPRTSLMESDAVVEFSAPTDSEPDTEVPSAMSWTPEDGFVEHEPPGRMRLVGQRGGFEDALAGLRGDHDSVTDEVDGSDDSAPREPSIRYVPEAGPRTVIADVPPDVAGVVETATGVRVGDARIDRSPAVSARAAALGALAYTEDGVVHLPDELGPLHEPATRAIVAHELTHVAQQRRLGGTRPDERTPDGASLEAEAKAVQRSVWSGRPVRPAFLRDGSSVPAASAEVPTAVQRLRDDDDPYEWQDRGMPPISGRDVVSSIFGWNSGRSDEDEADQEEWARDFEQDHADELQHKRDEKYRDLYQEARREALIESRRREVALEQFGHDDIMALRVRLDDEMPFEFGPPLGIDPYPGMLPEDDDDGDDEGGAGTGSSAEQRRLRTTSGGTSSSSTPPEIGRAAVSGTSAAAGRRSGGGGSAEPDFDWQGRSPTASEWGSAALGSVFGGALASLFGGDDDNDDERRVAEERRLPELIPRRHSRERELRHDRLVEVRTERIREGGSSHRPDSLDDDQIAAIRQQVDDDMPLEFAVPEYLTTDEDATLYPSGVFGPQLDEAPDEGEADAADVAGAAGEAATEGEAPTTTGQPTAPDESPEAVAGGEEAEVAEAAPETVAATAPADDDEDDEDDDEQTERTASGLFEHASDFDIDILANRIYGRMRRDLRRELLIDRERAGALADIR